MDTLYIVGNGFDLAHGLPTSYTNFHSFLNNERENNIIGFINEYFEFNENSKGLWYNFENDLSTFNHKAFYEDNHHHKPSDDNYKLSDEDCTFDDLIQQNEDFLDNLKESLRNWIESIDYNITKENRKYINKNAYFLTFNYTSTLSKVYEIDKSQILHIHGSLENDELILGHNKDSIPPTDTHCRIDNAINASTAIHNITRKPVEEIIKNNHSFFSECKKFKNIYVIGHSFSDIDLPYFEEIAKQTTSANWYFGYYYKNKPNDFDFLTTLKDLKRLEKALIKLNIPRENTTICTNEKLLNPFTTKKNIENCKCFKKMYLKIIKNDLNE